KRRWSSTCVGRYVVRSVSCDPSGLRTSSTHAIRFSRSSRTTESGEVLEERRAPDHTCGDGRVRDLIDQDETPGNPVVAVVVDHQPVGSLQSHQTNVVGEKFGALVDS